jgi:hypothetical protein
MLKDFVPIRKDVEALSSWYQQVSPALIEPYLRLNRALIEP